MADTKLPALTEVSVPALDDPLYTVDVSDTTDDATGTSRKLSLARLLGLHNQMCEGRLTTESGVPVSTSDRTSQSTLYFTPYGGNKISLYDGTRWKLYAFTEISLAISGLTADTNYDVFVYDSAGTLTLELSAAWSNDTTPADALATQDGVTVKSGATTRRWLGTIRTTGTTTTEDSDSKRFVWNAYNQVFRRLHKYEISTQHTWASTSFREWNNGTGGPHRVYFVNGEVQTFGSSGWVELRGATGFATFSLNSSTTEGLAVASDGTNTFGRTGLSANYQSRVGFNELVVTEYNGEFNYYRMMAQILA